MVDRRLTSADALQCTSVGGGAVSPSEAGLVSSSAAAVRGDKVFPLGDLEGRSRGDTCTIDIDAYCSRCKAALTISLALPRFAVRSHPARAGRSQVCGRATFLSWIPQPP